MGSERWFEAQRQMLEEKPLVKRCYGLWYQALLDDADSVETVIPDAKLVELGSGSSYLASLRPGVVTSDVEPGVGDMVIDARELPFPDRSVKALFLTHVFHHIPDVELFLREASRVLVPGGVISMIEETHTPFARLFFSLFHPEPYDDRTEDWAFPEGHSMLDSNQALSWVVFFRDRSRFESSFPTLRLERFRYLPWLSYLLSGGVNLRSFVPGFLEPLVLALDRLFRVLDPLFAIHCHLTIRSCSDEREHG